MHAGLIQGALQHLSAPPGLGPRREVHQLPDLSEYQSAPLDLARRVDHRLKNRHGAELVIERNATSSRFRCCDDAICLSQACNERLFANHMRTGRQTAQAEIRVTARRGAHNHDVGLARRQHGVEVRKEGHAESVDGTRPHPFVEVHRTDDLVRGKPFECRQMECEAGVSESNESDAQTSPAWQGDRAEDHVAGYDSQQKRPR